MLSSLKLFLKGIARRWWIWAVGLPSGVVSFVDLYMPQSIILQDQFRGLLAALGLVIFIGALLVAAFLTYHELRAAIPRDYDAAVGDALHDLYTRGRALMRGGGLARGRIDRADFQAWVDKVEAFLGEHLPGELRMFQTIRDDDAFALTGRRRVRHPHELRPMVGKLRLIMGRYEAQQ